MQQALARVEAQVAAYKIMNLRVNAAMTKGALGMGEASAVKVFGTELTQQVARELLEVVDQAGTRKGADAPLRGALESAYRFAVINTFGGGANELQRDIIAMAGLFMPRAPRDMRASATQNGECDNVTETTKDEFRKQLDELIGQPTGGSGKPTVAPDPVNQPMIRHWAYALADMNPVYLDPEFAAKSRFGGIVSPPVMLQAWTMPPPKIEGIAERGGVPIEMGKKNPSAFIDEAGLHRHRRDELRVRDRTLSPSRRRHLGETVFEDISDEKKTSLGTGYFVTWLTTYSDQNGEVLGRQRFRVFRFKAGTADGDSRLAPTVSPDTEFFWTGSRPQAAHPALHRMSDAASSAAADVPDCNSLEWDTSCPPAAAPCTAT